MQIRQFDLRLPRGFYTWLASTLLVLLGLGLIYLVVMERISPLAGLSLLAVLFGALIAATKWSQAID